ncbi:LOW QUALITY PROTEIN: lysophosphatidic acid receptor 5b [Lampris incognitus]|uniref:LOW QUALITY PROTEIN: lysophosphatidic acid receptor 5b n=1 Tax=Lampris incognitus TaxID=2546036 RepID=UPI0024B55105|nr:LOW QUALITY PROTEIN: lysophosphatidic acid receptor 5b [Lampris incognitus]
MNNTTSTQEPKLVYATIYGCVMLFGLPLNAVSLWILIRHHSIKTPSAVFMINLAISDLLLVISLPMRVYFYATGLWPFGVIVCVWFTMLFRNNIRSSAIFITCICVDRLLAVVYPLTTRHLRTTSNASKACIFVWLFILAVNIPESIDLTISMRICNTTSCFEADACQEPRHWIAHMQSVLVFSMLVVNVVSTCIMSWTLHKHLNDSVKVNRRMNVMLIFALNLMMFVIFFSPLSVALLIPNGKHAIRSAICLASVNCCLDPLFYYFSLDAFWKKRRMGRTSCQERRRLLLGNSEAACSDIDF